MNMRHWQDAAIAVVGAWLALSPWVIGVDDDLNVTFSFVIVGSGLVAASVGAMAAPSAWEEWIEAFIGVGLCASPWLLGYAAQLTATSNAFLTGALVIALALWVLISDRDFGFVREPTRS